MDGDYLGMNTYQTLQYTNKKKYSSLKKEERRQEKRDENDKIFYYSLLFSSFYIHVLLHPKCPHSRVTLDFRKN